MLYKRIVEFGTLSEPKGVPEPRFALAGTVNWMRALAILSSGTTIASARAAYAGVQNKIFKQAEENTIFEQLFFALHQLSAIEALRVAPRKSDVARIGIIAWYYAIYYAASAMIAAQTASFQEQHTSTAHNWDMHIAARGLSLHPFDLRVTTLVEKDAAHQIAAMRAGNTFDLTKAAVNATDAHGACCSYLSGSAGYYRWRASEDLKQSNEFRLLGKSDFKTKVARDLRNKRFAKRGIGFMHQAFRYRGKANYREALFLGYGAATETELSGYMDDLAGVSSAFLTMAGAFVAQRIGQNLWQEFLTDTEANRAFSISTSSVWQ